MIASGGQGDIIRATLNGKPIVIKKFFKIKPFRREIDSLKKLNHPNIIHLLEFIEIKETDNNKYFAILEYIPGSLRNYIDYNSDLGKYIRINDIKNICRQIISALEFCHEKEVYHLDVKPENILFDTKTMKATICDFGCSRLHNYIKCGQIGTKEYMAPEIINLKPFYANKADMWSFGITFIELLTNKKPFQFEGREPDSFNFLKSKDNNAFFNNIANGRDDITTLTKQFILDILQINYKMRPLFQDIKNHSWIQ